MSATMPPHMVQSVVRGTLRHHNKYHIDVCYEPSVPDQLVLASRGDLTRYDYLREQGIVAPPEDGVKMSIPMLREMVAEQRWVDLERYVMVCAAMVKQPVETPAEKETILSPRPTWWTSTTTTNATSGIEWKVYPIAGTISSYPAFTVEKTKLEDE